MSLNLANLGRNQRHKLLERYEVTNLLYVHFLRATLIGVMLTLRKHKTASATPIYTEVTLVQSRPFSVQICDTNFLTLGLLWEPYSHIHYGR